MELLVINLVQDGFHFLCMSVNMTKHIIYVFTECQSPSHVIVESLDYFSVQIRVRLHDIIPFTAYSL